jgi:predicted nucleotidyltransferase
MDHGNPTLLDGVPARVTTVLTDVVATLRDAWATDLVSVVLFGSAAEGKLGPTSDVNLLVVLRTFTPDQVARARDGLLAAEAAIKLRAMFVLDSELPSAANMFAQKFADILRRHRVIFGRDVLSSLKVARQAEIFRLRQVLLNLTLRLRDAYVSHGHQPEQVARILADVLGPLRASCATLLELEGAGTVDPNAAFEQVATALDPQNREFVSRMFAAHEGKPLNGQAGEVLLKTVEFLMQVSGRSARLAHEA